MLAGEEGLVEPDCAATSKARYECGGGGEEGLVEPHCEEGLVEPHRAATSKARYECGVAAAAAASRAMNASRRGVFS